MYLRACECRNLIHHFEGVLCVGVESGVHKSQLVVVEHQGAALPREPRGTRTRVRVRVRVTVRVRVRVRVRVSVSVSVSLSVSVRVVVEHQGVALSTCHCVCACVCACAGVTVASLCVGAVTVCEGHCV